MSALVINTDHATHLRYAHDLLLSWDGLRSEKASVKRGASGELFAARVALEVTSLCLALEARDNDIIVM